MLRHVEVNVRPDGMFRRVDENLPSMERSIRRNGQGRKNPSEINVESEKWCAVEIEVRKDRENYNMFVLKIELMEWKERISEN